MEALKLLTIAEAEQQLPHGYRWELIDGQLYDMSAPSTNHQRIVEYLSRKIGNYIEDHNGQCEVLPAPYDVQLDANDDRTKLQPDVIVVCDPNKLTRKRCIGAPDWVVEVVSPTSQSRDYLLKMRKYQAAGVREYWTINPELDEIRVYRFAESGTDFTAFKFESIIKVGIYPDLYIDFSKCRIK